MILNKALIALALGRTKMTSANPMTAPDSRDSVERVVAEMRAYEGDPFGTAKHVFRSWADRLQALARGPQQAGGEHKHEPALTLDENIILKQQDTIAALQAEVARTKAGYVELETMYQQQGLNAFALLKRAETAEAALREAGRDAERYRWLRRRNELTGADDPRGPFAIETNADDMIGHPNAADLDAAIDAAINGGQDAPR